MDTLGDEIPKEQARVRELVQRYRDPLLNGAGNMTALLMELALKAADKAVISGDIAEMIIAYKELRSWHD
jgi:hypothetical protein